MLSNLIKNLRLYASQSEKGQDLAEYSMLIGLIALLVVVSLTVIGASINTIFTLIATAIRNGLKSGLDLMKKTPPPWQGSIIHNLFGGLFHLL